MNKDCTVEKDLEATFRQALLRTERTARNASTMSEEIEKHILKRYEICAKLGKGAYGIVWKAIDKRNRQTVALKKCFDAFRNATDAQRTYREIQYLKQLADHDNIIKLISACAPLLAACLRALPQMCTPPAVARGHLPRPAAAPALLAHTLLHAPLYKQA